MSDIPSFLSRAGAYMTLIPIQPSPMAETSRLLFPSLRFFMMSFGCNSYGVGTTHIADASVAQAPFDAQLLRFSSNGSDCHDQCGTAPEFPTALPGEEFSPTAHRLSASGISSNC